MAYIKKEPIVEFITKGLNNPDQMKAYGYDAIEILAEIEYAPTADVVEVKHGKWLKVQELSPRYVCTNCRHLYNNMGYKYCPNCGAKMGAENALKERSK